MSEPWLVVVGAGPAALACLVDLSQREPDRLGDTIVVDPSGSWLHAWDERFAAQAIEHLRSPIVHHPGLSPRELQRFARRVEGGVVRDGWVELASRAAFSAFCSRLIADHGLDRSLVSGRVVDLQPGGTTVRVGFDDGQVVSAPHVVLATNPRRAVVPPWATIARHAGLAVHHAGEVMLCDVPPRVLVVGGGLTAVQLAAGAHHRGAEVMMVSRRPIRTSRFDVDAGWIGPRELRGFSGLTHHERRRAIDRARDGGSVPPFARCALDEAVEQGLRCLEVVEVRQVEPSGGGLLVSMVGPGTEATSVEVDEVWLATGSVVDPLADTATAALCARSPIEVVDGMPVLGDDLRWGDTGVHCVGALASLVLGPAAGILHGHRRAAMRVVSALTGLRAPAEAHVHECDRPFVRAA